MVPEKLLKCLDARGFINEVKSRQSSRVTLREAYTSVESDMETYFGKRKFSDFQSFRVVQSRHNRKK